MDILNSLATSVFGMGVVFLVLVLLIVLINLQTFVANRLLGRKGKPVARDLPAPPVKPAVATAAATAAHIADPGMVRLTGVDEKTAAMVMAIILDETGIDPARLYFKSIRALDEGETA